MPAMILPPLENGDRLEQKIFHARYCAMPERVRAELIGGIVYLVSPQKRPHGNMRARVLHWLVEYEEATPGVDAFAHVTHIIGPTCEVQPAACLLIPSERGGQTHETDDYIGGPPELIVEVASSTESVEFHAKREEYESHGVREYLVIALREASVFWFASRSGTFEKLAASSGCIFRSEVFPGLWLDAAALLRRDGPRIREVLQQGLASAEHAAFVAKLTER